LVARPRLLESNENPVFEKRNGTLILSFPC